MSLEGVCLTLSTSIVSGSSINRTRFCEWVICPTWVSGSIFCKSISSKRLFVSVSLPL